MKQILMTLTLFAGIGMMNQVSAQHRLKKDPVKQTKVMKSVHKVEQVKLQPVKVENMKVERRTIEPREDLMRARIEAAKAARVEKRIPERNKVYRD